MRERRLHFISIRYTDDLGFTREATVTLRDDPSQQVLRVEGLNGVVKTSVESYTIARPWTEKRVS